MALPPIERFLFEPIQFGELLGDPDQSSISQS